MAMASPSRLYLLSYNSLQSLGWFVALLLLLPCLASPRAGAAYAAAGDLICLLQTCAVLETVHGAIGYTAFIPLYPIGVGPGEMWTMYQALPFVKERNLYSGFFASFSMSYHSFLVALLVCYPFLWLKLYLHVFKQRKSKLQGNKKKVDRKKRA